MYWIRRIVSKFGHLFYARKAKGLREKGKVLMLHNVGGSEVSEFNISTSDFESFLKRLSTKNVIRLEDWKESKDFYAISIDDVPEDFYHNAFPLLKKYNIPFTLFVATGLLNTIGFISKSHLMEMASCELCTIGSHGVAHGEYTQLPTADKRKELSESCQKLSQLIGKPVDMYAFPYGSLYACGYTQKHLVSEYYKYGFGTVQLPVTEPVVLPDYYIPRINVTTNNIATI